jgi:hypothetical protein
VCPNGRGATAAGWASVPTGWSRPATPARDDERQDAGAAEQGEHDRQHLLHPRLAAPGRERHGQRAAGLHVLREIATKAPLVGRHRIHESEARRARRRARLGEQHLEQVGRVLDGELYRRRITRDRVAKGELLEPRRQRRDEYRAPPVRHHPVVGHLDPTAHAKVGRSGRERHRPDAARGTRRAHRGDRAVVRDLVDLLHLAPPPRIGAHDHVPPTNGDRHGRRGRIEDREIGDLALHDGLAERRRHVGESRVRDGGEVEGARHRVGPVPEGVAAPRIGAHRVERPGDRGRDAMQHDPRSRGRPPLGAVLDQHLPAHPARAVGEHGRAFDLVRGARPIRRRLRHGASGRERQGRGTDEREQSQPPPRAARRHARRVDGGCHVRC